MKNLLLVFVFLSSWFVTANAQVTGDFQSKATGNWGDATSWQTFDGSTWIDAVTAPDGTTGTITIQTGHSITVAAVLTINGASVVVNGYLKVTVGGITAPTSSPAFIFNDGSTYEHNINGGTIPTATWGDGSTCLITGAGATAPSIAVTPVSYYNYTWNCPGQSSSIHTGWDNVTVRGDLTCTASGPSGGTIYWRMTSAATTRTITINGNVIINGGNLTVSGSSGAAQYNTTVNGNIVVSGNSKFSLCAGSGGFGTWYLNGDFSVSGTAQFFLPSNKTVNTILFFSKPGGTQNFTYSSSVANQNMNYGVMNNSTVLLNSPLTPYGTSSANIGHLVLTSGKFVTSASNIITLTAFDSVYTGTGYVDGPLAATVAVATSKTLTLPLGKGSIYRPVVLNLTQDAATSTVYTAELIESAPPANALPSTLDAVSNVRYFHFVKGAGANVSSATIQLNYDTNDGVDVSDKDQIRIAKDDGAGSWINLGGSGTANNTGSILSNSFGTTSPLGPLTTNDFVIAHVNPLAIPTLATLTTNAITFISTTFATSGGVITNDGNAAISAKGVCWNIAGTPTISDSHTSEGFTTTPFISSITGLSAGGTYHVRAYATNSAGTAYGNELTFTTLSALVVPTLVTNPVTNIVNTSATGNGNISDWGGSAITDRGICWSLSHNPTTANDFNSVGPGGTGAFTAPIGGLLLGSTYYARAYATNSTGTAYGVEVSFATPAAMPDVVRIVDKSGINCDYTNIYDAFLAVPTGYTGHWFIYVRDGVYYDKVTLAAGKINVILVGQSRDNTILTYDDYAGNNRTTHGVLSNGTNTSYSVAIDAPDFQAQNITFQNTSNAYAPGVTSAQAVALRTNGDRQSYYNCKMLGFQDTYYTQGGLTGPDRIYNKSCYVEGSVDFIFGRDVALFDNCTIFCNRQGGVLTAAATEAGYTYGYVFLNSLLFSPAAGQIGADGNPMTTFYLGRPWQTSPKTVFINCYEPLTVNANGWTVMGPNPSLYSEHACVGPGAASSRPITWPATSQPSAITDGQAALYTIANIFSKNNAGSGFSYAANWTPALIPIDTTLAVLPVEMTTFTSRANSASVELNWKTATEVNNFGFDVERKITSEGNTNASWLKIGFVQGNGNSNSTKEYSFTDKDISTSGKYSYRLKQIDKDGQFKYSAIAEVDLNRPTQFILNQNYPNPFNPVTSISYEIPVQGKVTLKVYDILGNEVATLVNEKKEAGRYQVQFGTGNLASGVYIYQLRSDNFVQSKKMILMK